MRKILVGYLGDLKFSGIDSYLKKVIPIAVENGVHLDFLTSQYTKEAEEYLKQFSFSLFPIHNLKKPLLQYRDVKEVLKKGNYDAAYFNISEPLNCMGA